MPAERMNAPASDTWIAAAATIGLMMPMIEAPQEEKGARTATGAEEESMR